MTKKTLKLIALCLILATGPVAGAKSARETGIVPCPQSVVWNPGQFNLAGATVTCDPAIGEKSIAAVTKFATRLSEATGKDSIIKITKSGRGISFENDPSLEAENYTLDVRKNGITIKAPDYNGIIYAIATLKQLMPEEIYGTDRKVNVKWEVRCCSISDGPRFAYRGMHLDCCRHFWTIEETKRYIDIMAVYKLNRLHWHLTEDQGWRIEIKSLPKLTEVSAWRNGTMKDHDWTSDDGLRYGGFYTQEEAKEIIEYAAERGITVIPEVDLPGHMVAALAAYPELACYGGPFEVRKIWGIANEVLCPGKETTFEFLEKVLGEIADLFPSEYIHIGGDECPKIKWENCPDCQARIKELGLEDNDKYTAEQQLQCYVTGRMQKFLATKGKKIIGWDEILEGDLDEGATVMSWRGVEGGIEAAKRGFDAIMTPSPYVYFDYCQAKNPEKEPLTIGGFLPLEKVYGYEPFEGMESGTEHHIQGVQANLWTEYISTAEHLEYMLLPRMLALSEVAWSNPDAKNYNAFLKEIQQHQYKIFDTMGYSYRRY